MESDFWETGTQFKNLTDKDKKLYWCFYKHRINLSIEMVYFEIFYNSDSNSLFTIGACMHANDTAAAQIIRPLISKPIAVKHSGEFEISISGILDGGALDFSSSIKQAIDINAMSWKLLSISSKIRETKFARNNKILASWNESYEDNISDENPKDNTIEVVCPACFNRGFQQSLLYQKQIMLVGLQDMICIVVIQ